MPLRYQKVGRSANPRPWNPNKQPNYAGTDQISVMRQLSAAAASWLLDIPETTLRQQLRTYPADRGKYNARELLRIVVGAAAESVEVTDESTAKNKLASEKARVAELRRLEMEGALVPLAELTGDLGAIVQRLRVLGETLQRNFGREAVEMLNHALDDCQRHIEHIDEPLAK